MGKKRGNKKFRAFDADEKREFGNNSAPAVENDAVGTCKEQKIDGNGGKENPPVHYENTTVQVENPTVHDESPTVHDENPILKSDTFHGVPSSVTMKELPEKLEAVKLDSSQDIKSNNDNQSRQKSKKEKRSKKPNYSKDYTQLPPTAEQETKPPKTNAAENTHRSSYDMKPARSSATSDWSEEIGNAQIVPGSQQENEGKNIWNPDAQEFRPKENIGREISLDVKPVESQKYSQNEMARLGQESFIETSHNRKKDGNYNHQQKERHSNISDYRSRQFFNSSKSGSSNNHSVNNNRRPKKSFSETDRERRTVNSQDRHEGGDSSKNRQSRKRSVEDRESRSTDEKYRNVASEKSAPQPGEEKWETNENIKQGDNPTSSHKRYGRSKEKKGRGLYFSTSKDRPQHQNGSSRGYQDGGKNSKKEHSLEKKHSTTADNECNSWEDYNEDISESKKHDFNKVATSKETFAAPQNTRGFIDPRMIREREKQLQNIGNWNEFETQSGGMQSSKDIKSEKTGRQEKNVDHNEEDFELQKNLNETEKNYDGWTDAYETEKNYDGWTDTYKTEKNDDGWTDTYHVSYDDKTAKQRKSYPETKFKDDDSRMSLGDKKWYSKVEKIKMHEYDRSYEKTDDEYKEFNLKFRWNEDYKYVKVIEKEQDLFMMPKEYSLGHCVAEDLRMGSGIAVTFKREFKELDDLLSQRQRQGGLAVLKSENRYIYYLVTKRLSTGKPTYETFWSSLKKMRDHIISHDVKKLAIPRIGCGLDRLDWVKVKFMIEFLFKAIDIEIVVCNFQQNYGKTKQKLQTTPDLSSKSKIKKGTPTTTPKSNKGKGKNKKR
nr:uncharacterized protein LOC111504128 isoform X2 [Leptinotarsa decemlineata]